MRTVKSTEEALRVAVQIIEAQDRLLISYRIGGRPPGAAIDRLNTSRPRLEAWLSAANQQIEGGTDE